jgi:hypothetical protein
MIHKLTLSATLFLVVTLVAGHGFATAPMIDDKLPDVQLIIKPTGSPTVDGWELDTESFDLDDFIIDADTAPGNIDWGIQLGIGHQFYYGIDQLGENMADVVVPGYAGGDVGNMLDSGDNTVDVFGFQYTGTLNLRYMADDAFTYTGDLLFGNTIVIEDGTLHFSTFRCRTPQVGLDNRIGTVVSTPYTWVIGTEAITSGAGLLDSGNLDVLSDGAWVETQAGSAEYDWQGFDLTGDTLAIQSMVEVTIDSNGVFSVIPRQNPGSNQPKLNRPVLVSFVAMHPTCSDWSGGTVLMTPALTPDTEIKPSVGGFSSFEGFGNGDTIPDVAAGERNGWSLVLGKTTGSHSVVNTGYPSASWPGAITGSNVLKVTVSSDNRQVRIISSNITPVEAGATYGLSMNVATDSTDSSTTPRVFLRAKGNPAGDNTTGLKVGKTAMPTSSDGWKQLFTTYTEPLAAATVPGADGTGSYNFHYGGVQLFLQFAAFGTSPETNIYCDNVYFYKLSDGPAASMEDEGFCDADLDVGAVAREMGFLSSLGGTPDAILGDLEASSLALAGWEYTLVSATDSGTVTQLQPKYGSKRVNEGDTIELGDVSLNTTVNHTQRATASNCVQLKLDGARGRESSDAH